MTTMTYKSYEAIVEFDEGADIFQCEVSNLRDVITFQGRSVDELKRAFSESVDDYLAFCKARGEEPEKPFSGQFVVRGAFLAQGDGRRRETRGRQSQQTGDHSPGARGQKVTAAIYVVMAMGVIIG